MDELEGRGGLVTERDRLPDAFRGKLGAFSGAGVHGCERFAFFHPVADAMAEDETNGGIDSIRLLQATRAHVLGNFAQSGGVHALQNTGRRRGHIRHYGSLGQQGNVVAYARVAVLRVMAAIFWLRARPHERGWAFWSITAV